MKADRIMKQACAALASCALLWSCSQAFDSPLKAKPDVDAKKNARITLEIPRPKGNDGDGTEGFEGARAVGNIVDRIMLTAIDDAGTVLSSSSTTVSKDDGITEISLTVPSGVPLRLKAELFNLAMSETSPTVSGLSAQITVQPGETLAVTITCLPVNPIAVGPLPAVIVVGTNVINTGTGMNYPSPMERWLKVTVAPGSYATVYFDYNADSETPAIPGAGAGPKPISELYFQCDAYDGSGKGVEITRPYETDTGYAIVLGNTGGSAEKAWYLLPMFRLRTSDSATVTPQETECKVSAETIALAEDSLEENDAKETAASIESGKVYNLTLTDEDWFKLELAKAGTLSVSCADGDGGFIDTAVIAPDGTPQSGFKPVKAVAGTYFIHVYAGQGPCKYSLKCALGPGEEDSFGNDSSATACDLSTLKADDSFVLGSRADWFKITLAGASSLSVTPSFANAKSGDRYAVTLYDSKLNEVTPELTSWTTQTPVQGVEEELYAGTYYVKFEATEGHPVYALSASSAPIDAAYADACEQNDARATAKPFTEPDPSYYALYLADDDWFSYKSAAADYLYVNFGVVPSMALQVTIYDAANNDLFAKTLPQWEQIAFEFLEDTQYYIRVRPIWAAKEGYLNGIVQYDIEIVRP